MELQKKTIVFLGDSITEGAGTSNPKNIYWNVVARRTGALCYGYGIGGTRIAKQIIPSSNPRWDRYFGSRVDDMKADADIVVVFGGTNDFGHGDAPIGVFGDRGEHTFYGAADMLIQKLIDKYPGALLVIMTPLHRLNEDKNTEMDSRVYLKGTTLEEYVDAIGKVAAFYGIPVLDLFRTSGIQPRKPVLQERYMPDGLHPNDAGHERIAQRLIGFLCML